MLQIDFDRSTKRLEFTWLATVHNWPPIYGHPMLLMRATVMSWARLDRDTISKWRGRCSPGTAGYPDNLSSLCSLHHLAVKLRSHIKPGPIENFDYSERRPNPLLRAAHAFLDNNVPFDPLAINVASKANILLTSLVDYLYVL